MDSCVFCEKIADDTVDIRTPGVGVYYFEPLNPVTPGHRLFVPREHIARAEQNPGITGLVFNEAAGYARSMGSNFNLIVNSGPAAGQTVFHLHVHYVPRRAGDGLLMPWGGVES